MAEAFGNMYGHEIIKAYSSGSYPSGSINPKAIAAMQETGYDLSAHESKGLEDIPDFEYDLVVTMGCGDECPVVRTKQRLEWNIPDPKHMDAAAFAEVRDQIRDMVKELIDNLRN